MLVLSLRIFQFVYLVKNVLSAVVACIKIYLVMGLFCLFATYSDSYSSVENNVLCHATRQSLLAHKDNKMFDSETLKGIHLIK